MVWLIIFFLLLVYYLEILKGTTPSIMFTSMSSASKTAPVTHRHSVEYTNVRMVSSRSYLTLIVNLFVLGSVFRQQHIS